MMYDVICTTSFQSALNGRHYSSDQKYNVVLLTEEQADMLVKELDKEYGNNPSSYFSKRMIKEVK